MLAIVLQASAPQQLNPWQLVIGASPVVQLVMLILVFMAVVLLAWSVVVLRVGMLRALRNALEVKEEIGWLPGEEQKFRDVLRVSYKLQLNVFIIIMTECQKLLWHQIRFLSRSGAVLVVRNQTAINDCLSYGLAARTTHLTRRS